MNQIKAGVILILVGLVIIFAIQNTTTVEIQFLFWSFSAPRVFMVVSLFAIGFLLGWIVCGMSLKKK